MQSVRYLPLQYYAPPQKNQNLCSLSPKLLTTTDLFTISMVLSFPECLMSTYYITFQTVFLLFLICIICMSLNGLIIHLSLLMNTQHSIVWIHYRLFIHSCSERDPSCFKFFRDYKSNYYKISHAGFCVNIHFQIISVNN